MKIGPYHIGNPLALAPMAGVTDRCFRQLCRQLGAGYVVTEMLAANPALLGTRKSKLRGDFSGEPEPVAVQIAGADPDWMARAARYNAERGAAIIDINMGCPAKKVCNKLAGSALLSDPERVHDILKAVVAAVDVPVTLKIRTGPDRDHRNGVEIARMAEDIGVAALAVHGRTRADRFRGQAEYDTIAKICATVSIPVFANGDIDTPQRAAEVLRRTGADGLMIGRAAQGNPWIFRDIRDYLDRGTVPLPPRSSEVHRVMRHHLRHLHATYGQIQGVRVARKHIGWYLSGRPGARPYRDALMRAESAAAQFRLLADYFGSRDPAGQSPRMVAPGPAKPPARRCAA